MGKNIYIAFCIKFLMAQIVGIIFFNILFLYLKIKTIFLCPEIANQPVEVPEENPAQKLLPTMKKAN